MSLARENRFRNAAVTATLVAILSLTVVGIAITLAVDGTARSALLLGQSFLYGSGAIFAVLLAMSMVHVPWTLIRVTVAALIIFCAAALFASRRAPGHATRPGIWTFHFPDLVTFLTLVGYAFYATLARVWEWDFWAIWGLKARQFLEIGGYPLAFLERPLQPFPPPP